MEVIKNQCQNCRKSFEIHPQSQEFYLRMKVPSPTFCPYCRFIRRLSWRNERSLYRRKSDKSGKSIICLYSEDKPFKVFDQSEWWGDDWGASEFGRNYNFSETFFKQFRALQEAVPRLSIFNTKCVNSEYTNQSYENKNCYLCFSLTTCEDCSYCTNIGDVKSSLDCLYVFKSELMYDSVDCDQCYRSKYLYNCESCVDSAFLYDCRGCTNCIGGVGLRNKQYVFFGEELNKEDYEKKKLEFDLGTYSKVRKGKDRLAELMKNFPRRASRQKNCVSSSGDFIRNCKSAHACFGSYDMENAGHVVRAYGSKDVADSYGLGRAELAYETVGTEEVYNVRFTNVVDPSKNLTYCDLCFNCSDCFGCVGLRGKQYCILNKEYSREEYEALVPKIIEHMNTSPYVDKKSITYKFGEFFPSELSPFSYNESLAQEYQPMTKKEIEQNGLSWKETDVKNYSVDVKVEDIKEEISEATEDILKKIIACEHAGNCADQCSTAFRLTPTELKFYKTQNIPLPHLCPNCRHYERLKLRNPFQIWNRVCGCAGNTFYKNTTIHAHGSKPCENLIETSYSPEQDELVYCEDCYQKEVN